MDNPVTAPPLTRVLSLGQDEADTILTKAPADIEAGMHRLAVFALSHLDSVPGPITYREALVALLTEAQEIGVRAARIESYEYNEALLIAPLPAADVQRMRDEGLLGSSTGWREYGQPDLQARLDHVRFMAGPDEPADAPAPVAAPAQDIEPKPLSPAPAPRSTHLRQPKLERETRPASLREAAGWFLLKDPRTLQRAIAKGSVAARKLSDKRWVFDVDEVDPDADAEPK